MSAWIVSKVHIDVIVQAMVTYELILPEQATEAGKTLWKENHRSINYRYNERGRTPAYGFEIISGRVDPQVVHEAIECLDYQSCERPDWKESKACKMLVDLDVICVKRMPEFDRYGKVVAFTAHGDHSYSWGIDHRDVFHAAGDYRRASWHAVAS